MKLLLLFFLSWGALGLYVFLQPTARNITLLKRTVLGCVALLAAFWVRPEWVGAAGALLVLAAALWLAGRFLLWPLHYLASLLHR